MAVNLSPLGGVGAQFFDSNGNPLSGGLIYTYAAGTSTPAATYTSSSGLIQHSNPIVLDAAGRVPTGEIWLTFGTSYKFVLKTSNDVLIGTYDNINGITTNGLFANYTGDGITTAFALPIGITVVGSVYINGVYQFHNTYSIVGPNLVFTEAPPVTSKIEVEY